MFVRTAESSCTIFGLCFPGECDCFNVSSSKRTRYPYKHWDEKWFLRWLTCFAEKDSVSAISVETQPCTHKDATKIAFVRTFPSMAFAKFDYRIITCKFWNVSMWHCKRNRTKLFLPYLIGFFVFLIRVCQTALSLWNRSVRRASVLPKLNDHTLKLKSSRMEKKISVAIWNISYWCRSNVKAEFIYKYRQKNL